MNIMQFINKDKHAISRRLRNLAVTVEVISHIEIPDPQTIILEGNVFDVITAIYSFRYQYINFGLAWDVMELTLDPQKPYTARLSYKVAKVRINNHLKFKIKVIAQTGAQCVLHNYERIGIFNVGGLDENRRKGGKS